MTVDPDLIKHLQGLAIYLKSRGYSDMEIREAELRYMIEDEQRKYREAIEPFIKELGNIAACKPPAPVTLPDGRIMVYVGPVPVWTKDGLKWPK